MTQHCRIATFNANSIRSRLDQILSWMAATETDVLCVQETKVQDSEFPVEPIHEAGLSVVYHGQKAHAGVAILSREPLEQVDTGLRDGEPDEPRLIRGIYRGIAIVNTYVPQGREVDSEHFQFKLRWLERLRAFFERHYTPETPLLWLGDLNVAPEPIDVYDPKRLANHVDYHPEARAALQRVCEWGLVDVFRRHHPDEPRQYTYFDYRMRNVLERQAGWRIDHILATGPMADASTAAWIDVQARMADRPSDHTFLIADFDLPPR